MEGERQISDEPSAVCGSPFCRGGCRDKRQKVGPSDAVALWANARQQVVGDLEGRLSNVDKRLVADRFYHLAQEFIRQEMTLQPDVKIAETFSETL